MGEEQKQRKRRRPRNSGGLFQKTGYWKDLDGVPQKYTYWQATKELSGQDLPPGVERRRITGSGATKTEATARLEANVRRYLLGGTPAPIRKAGKARGHTLSEWFHLWHGGLYEVDVGKTVQARYKGFFQNHIEPHLGNCYLAEITGDDIKRLFKETLPAKRKIKDGLVTDEPLLSNASLLNIRKVFNIFMAEAHNRGLIAFNPVKQMKAPKVRKSETSYEVVANGERLRRLFEEELDRFNYPHFAQFFLMMLGLRQSERLGLSWGNFRNLGTGGQTTLTIDRQIDRHLDGSGWYIRMRTKSGEPRTIPLFEPFLQVIRDYRIQWEATTNAPGFEPAKGFERHLFIWEDGKPITPRQDTREWHRLLKEHNIDYFRAHQARHITATWLADNPNVPIESVQAILGHDSESMAYWYARITEKQTSRAVQGLGENFPSLTAETKATGFDRASKKGIPAAALLQKLRWEAEEQQRRKDSGE